MITTRLLTVALCAASAMAASVPSLASRQSSGICGTQAEVPLSDIEVWSDHTMLGYLSPDLFSNGPPTAYGWMTYNWHYGLQDVFACGQPGSSSTFVMGAANARPVPGTDSNAIGIVVNQWSTTLAPGNSNWGVIAPTFPGPAGAGPNPASVGSIDGSYYEGSTWTIQDGKDSAGQSHRYLVPAWVNPGASSAVPLDIAIMPFGGAIAVTGDYNAFYADHSYLGPWQKVKFAVP